MHCIIFLAYLSIAKDSPSSQYNSPELAPLLLRATNNVNGVFLLAVVVRAASCIGIMQPPRK